MKLKHQGSLLTSESSSEVDEEEDEVEPLEIPQQRTAGASPGPGVSPRPRSSPGKKSILLLKARRIEHIVNTLVY